MTTFQKLLLISIFSLIVIIGLYLYRNQELKKDELQFQQTQKQISDCKYLLANEELFNKDDVNLLDNYLLLSKGGKEELAQKVWKQYEKQSGEYLSSKSNCLELLRQSKE